MRFITLFISSAFICSLGSAQTTLLCEGFADGSNTRKGEYRSAASTSVEFSESGDFLAISDASKLQVGATYPYKEIQVFKDAIFWNTVVDPVFGKGTFGGSINRITGEMKTSFFVFSTTGDMINVSGKLMCQKQVGRKF
jgi:hypothetical protein